MGKPLTAKQLAVLEFRLWWDGSESYQAHDNHWYTELSSAERRDNVRNHRTSRGMTAMEWIQAIRTGRSLSDE